MYHFKANRSQGETVILMRILQITKLKHAWGDDKVPLHGRKSPLPMAVSVMSSADMVLNGERELD